MSKRTITFGKTTAADQRPAQAVAAANAAFNPDVRQDDLVKERPEAPYHPGQDLSEEQRRQNQLGSLRFGYERLGHMYSLGLPYKMEELQGRHPFDFVEETKEHFKLHPDPVKKPAQPEDTTLFDVREWLEPIIRKGQVYWDYCRDKWMEKESKMGAACAPISCMFSLWSITDSVLQYGGYVFMAVYLVVTVVFIIPFIYMELILGQFHRQGLINAIRQTCPLFQGLAYLMLAYSLFDYLLSTTRLSWLVYYLLSSVSHEYPWQRCKQPWNTGQCVEILDHDGPPINQTGELRTAAVDYYRVHVIRPWKHWEIVHGKNPTMGQVILGILPNPYMLVIFLGFVVLFRRQLKKWCRELGKEMVFMSYFAFMFLGFSVLAYDSLFPPDIHHPILRWFFRKDHLKFFWNKNTWTTAIRHAVVGSGVGTGIYITFGSHNTFPHDEIKYMAILSGLSSYGVHIAIAFFFLLCHFTVFTTAPIYNTTTNTSVAYGYDLMFEQFPQTAAQHPAIGVGHCMFFVMTAALIILACLRILCVLHVLCQAFYDWDKEYYEPCRYNYQYWEHDKIKRQQRYANYLLTPQRKGQLITKILLYAAIYQVGTFVGGGSLVHFVVEDIWYNYVPMLIILIECIAVFFFAGVRTLNEYVRRMTTWQATIWYRFAWKIFVPLVPVLYFTHPPRKIGKVGGVDIPDVVRFLGYVCAGLPFFFMYMSILHVWRKSRAKKFCNKFKLEATPEHEHAGLIAGRKPSTRLHWMHHMHIPAGISRGAGLPPYELPPRKPDPYRYNWDNMWLNFFWYFLGFNIVSKIWNKCTSYPAEDDMIARNFTLFPYAPLPMKGPKKERPFPDYLPNQAIRRVYKLKKNNEFRRQRVLWLAEKVELEKERMAADHEERDIETGIMARHAKEAKEEDEEKEFYDMFNTSSDENEGVISSSDISTPDSFDISSDDGKGRLSSPSVSTSDSFDSQDSLFGVSGDEDGNYRQGHRETLESDTVLGNEEDNDVEEDLEEFEDPDEIPAPPMDFGEDEGVPFDDETDSWDLEDLEQFEDALSPVEEPEEDTFTSEEETDTDELIDALQESKEESETSSSSSSEEDPLFVSPGNASEKTVATSEGKKKDNSSEESNSWSISCGSSSTCSSEYSDSSEDGDSEDDSISSEDSEGKRRASYDSDDESTWGKPEKRDTQLKFFRNKAENLDTFLHYSKKKEKERMEVIHEQVQRAKKEESRNREEKKKLAAPVYDD